MNYLRNRFQRPRSTPPPPPPLPEVSSTAKPTRLPESGSSRESCDASPKPPSRPPPPSTSPPKEPASTIFRRRRRPQVSKDCVLSKNSSLEMGEFGETALYCCPSSNRRTRRQMIRLRFKRCRSNRRRVAGDLRHYNPASRQRRPVAAVAAIPLQSQLSPTTPSRPESG